MAKVRGPLLSMSAQGQIGKSQVYGSWRGIPTVRQLVTPRNPQTSEQSATRNVFSSLSGLWKQLGSLAAAPWNAAVVGRPLVGRNLFMGNNTKNMRGEADREDFQGSPGAGGGPAGSGISGAGGTSSGEIDVTLTVPGAPTDWTLASVVAFAMQDGDPATAVPLPVGEAENSSPTAGQDNDVTITGLEAGTLHVITAWPVWTKPNGTTAYGASLTSTATSTA